MRTIFRNNYTPVMGEYHERYVIDEARHKSYLFDCDGVFNELPYVYVTNEKGTSEEYAVSQKLFTDEVTKLADDIDYEAAARAAADIELGEAIDKETSDREDADTDLQNQIDLIKASSDVVDVVGTYAELQAYDTTKLNDNDIVKVLDDETRDDGITYYRWSTSTQTFTFVGALSAYYSKDETDTLLAGKQDTLTAGTNIQINDNVISATDTTYSDFTGTDGTAAGAAGLVPAPATTDAGKYLKADGTWATISIPTVTLYSGTGQNTDGAMTQKAVTDTLFESNDTTRIKIGSGVVNGGAASVVIGSQGAQTLTPNSIAIGNGGTTAGSSGGNGYNVAIGSYGVNATGGQSVAIGGYGAMATAEGAITIGTGGAQASAAHSVAIGHGGTTAAHSDSVALGSASTTGRTYELSLGQNASGRNPEKTRYIAHVTAGVNSTDAVNVAQLNAAIPGVMTGATSSAAGTSGLVPAPAAGDGAKYLAGDGTWKTISAPTVTLYSGTGQNTDGAMTQKAVTDTIFENNDTKRIKIGNGATTSNSSSIAIGESATASGTNALAIGPKENQWNNTARATGAHSISIGTGQAKQDCAIAIGNYVIADRPSSIAIGKSCSVFTGTGVAIGSNIIVSGNDTIGIGDSADVEGSRSIAIGKQAKAGMGPDIYTDSIALGSYSKSGRDSELSIGTPADSSNAEKTRYIAHVTAGVNNTDAVNKKQLDDAIAAVPSASNINSTDWSALWQ